MRTILHVDMNSYFATAEQQANPYLRGRPVGIIKAEGRGCVIAASIEAKKCKVKTGTTVWDAKKLCPQIILVPSDMDKYFSLTRNLVQIAKDYSPALEVFSIDEFFLDVTDSKTLFGGGALQIAMEIKERVKRELGEWMKCSVGISFTKLLAKLASEMHKPDGLTWLTPENYLSDTAGVAVEEVCGIGRSRTSFLKARGVCTLGEARELELPKELEDLVWLRLDDDVNKVEDLEPAKSVSRTFTTFKTLNSKLEIIKLIRNLIEEASMKLREMNMEGRTFCLSLDEFWARKTINSATSDPLIIFNLLINEYEKNPVISVRQAGVWITNLTWSNYRLPFLERREALLRANDSVNSKFGLFTVYPASLLGGELVRPEVTGYLGDKYYRFKAERSQK